MNKKTAAITAVGGYVPDFILTNQLLETMVETNDEWITSRTGIKERRILKEEGQGTSYLAIKAAEDLITKKNLNVEEIDLVLVATATPDMLVASTAAYVASEIGAVGSSISFALSQKLPPEALQASAGRTQTSSVTTPFSVTTMPPFGEYVCVM